jgi:hypothetical protein
MRHVLAVALSLGVLHGGEARAQAEVVLLAGLALDVGLGAYDVGIALADRLPSRAYAITEIALVVPQLGLAAWAASEGSHDAGAALAVFGGALAAHGVWRLAFAEEPPLVPAVGPGAVVLAGTF